MPKFAANLTMLFSEVDFLDRFAAAARYGFTGVEYLFPYAYEKDVLIEKLMEHRLTQVLHNLPAGNWAAGDRGIACHPDRVGEFQDGVGKAIEYAEALGCRMLNCLVGRAPSDEAPDKVRETVVANLRFAAKRLKDKDIRLLIEAVNTIDVSRFYLSNSAQVLDVMTDVDDDNLFIQYDIYHMQMMEGNLAATIEKHLSRIAHIQLADVPGRHEPGTGEINFPFLFQRLEQRSYTGWIGCEYIPLTTTSEGLMWIEKMGILSGRAVS